MGEGLTTSSVIAKSRVSSDGLIDDDFETELGGLDTSVSHRQGEGEIMLDVVNRTLMRWTSMMMV